MLQQVEGDALKSLKLLLSVILILSVLITPVSPVQAEENNDKEEIFSAMLSRAEAAVNYEWIPTQDIAVWNENPYNGKMYFPAGEKVKGVPYTLFFSEIGVDSLLSLEEYKDKVDINYSTTAYCNSVGAMRTGPVYGSCCATFVSEVFGGSFVNGNSPRYDSVYKIINSGHCETYYNVKASDIEPGDALSNISGSHIIWVGEVTDTYITIYESTPPVARRVTLYFDSNVFADGYLHYGDSSNEKSNIYNVVSKSNELSAPAYEIDKTYEKYGTFKAYPCVTENFEVFKSDLVTHGGEIYTGDYCTIYEVYTNGWCKVNFPLDSGGTITAYTPISNFIEDPNAPISSFTSEEYIELFPTKAMGSRIFRIYPNDVCDYFGTADNCTQLFMPHMDGYYVLGWADISNYASETPPKPPVATMLSVNTLPQKTTYEIGEALDTTGLSLTLTYSDNSSEVITEGFSVDGFSSSTDGLKTVAVSYQGLSTTFDVTVLPNVVETPKYQLTSATGKAGSVIEIDVAIANNPGIISLRNQIVYDTTALELVSVSDTGLLKGYTAPSSQISSPYTLRWADSLAIDNNTSNGTVVKLTFKIKENTVAGTYDVSITPIESRNIDGTKVEFESAMTTVTVIDYIIGDVDDDGEVSDWDAILLNRYLAGWNIAINPLASDVDNDGEVSDWDAIVLERYLAGWLIELGN